jgi:NitT/TauT family transport system permease protein/sulfonate transport system permease protein
MLTFAEMLASNSGIGFLVLFAQRTYRYEMMFVGIFTMCLLGGTAAYLSIWLERRVLDWYYATRAMAE